MEDKHYYSTVGI